MTHKRWTSRKFLLTLAAQLTAVAALLWPEHESAIVEASRSITAMAVLVLASLGYVQAEASVDREHHDAPPAASPAEGVDG